MEANKFNSLKDLNSSTDSSESKDSGSKSKDSGSKSKDSGSKSKDSNHSKEQTLDLKKTSYENNTSNANYEGWQRAGNSRKYNKNQNGENHTSIRGRGFSNGGNRGFTGSSGRGFSNRGRPGFSNRGGSGFSNRGRPGFSNRGGSGFSNHYSSPNFISHQTNYQPLSQEERQEKSQALAQAWDQCLKEICLPKTVLEDKYIELTNLINPRTGVPYDAIVMSVHNILEVNKHTQTVPSPLTTEELIKEEAQQEASDEAQPSTTQEPSDEAQPSTAQEPSDEAQPSTAQEPSDEAQPSTTQEPSDEAQPSTTQEPSDEAQPSTTHDESSETIEELLDSEDDTNKEQVNIVQEQVPFNNYDTIYVGKYQFSRSRIYQNPEFRKSMISYYKPLDFYCSLFYNQKWNTWNLSLKWRQ